MTPTQSIYDAYKASGYDGYQNGGFVAEAGDSEAIRYEYKLIDRIALEAFEGVNSNLSARQVSHVGDGFIPKPKAQ